METSNSSHLHYIGYTLNSQCLLHSGNQTLHFPLQWIVFLVECGDSRDDPLPPIFCWFFNPIMPFRWSDWFQGQWKRQEKRKHAYVLYCEVVNLSFFNPFEPVQSPSLSMIFLSVVLVTWGQLWYENIKGKIPEINISLKLHTVIGSIMEFHTIPFHPAWNMNFFIYLSVLYMLLTHLALVF
jgi:hypothetical protein